jgi:Zn-dependent protease
MENHSLEKERSKKKWGILGAIGALLLTLGGKLKVILPLFIKLLKLGKAGGTVWSMLLMVGTYALIYPWSFAVGLVLMIFIHEMGHVWAAKRKGLPVSAPAFIPFLGALVMMKKQPQDAETEAYIAIGGPLLGSLGAVGALILGVVTQYEALFAIAWTGLFINLINLLPIHPLDGGRIVTAISRWLWVVGLIVGLFVIIYLGAFILLIFWLMFAWELYQIYVRGRKSKTKQVNTMVKVDRQFFLSNYLPIPGPEHRRALDFIHHSLLDEKRTVLDLILPGVGLMGRIDFPNGNVSGVHLTGTKEVQEEYVVVNIQIEYVPSAEFQIIKEDRYYQVTARTRLKYGLSYFGLVAVIVWLMTLSLQLAPALDRMP